MSDEIIRDITGQEIQTLQKIAVKRLESIEKFFRTNKQGEEVQAKGNSKDLALPVPLRVTDDLPRVLAT